jgi:MFS family permease
MHSVTVVMKKKWPTILLLSFAELLGMAVWFSASAVIPALTSEWGLDDGIRAWLTMSVQAGFVVGTLASAFVNLPDRAPSRFVFGFSAIAAGISSALIPLFAKSAGPAIVLRALTGIFLAGVYPVGMKIMATWTKEDRGLGIGLLVGALTVGSAAPHLLGAIGSTDSWQSVIYLAAGLAIAGGFIGLFFIDEGPFRAPVPPFNWRYVSKVMREPEVVLANLGYLGHMWELYAMWSWIPLFLLASFTLSGVAPLWASLTAFAVIGIGGLGSAYAGKLADRYGRTKVTIGSMAISGTCALIIGQFFGGHPVLLAVIALIWGLTVVADSAQFSAAISELAQPDYVGTTITLQTALGFSLTLVTIRLIPALESWVGWQWAFSFLLIGPILGIWAMWKLRQSPEAVKLAGGRR